MIPASRDVAWHEAHHAAALLLAGFRVEARIDWPGDALGSVRIIWGEDGIDSESARHDLIAALMGFVAAREPFPEWPLKPSLAGRGLRRDTELAAKLAEYLRLDAVEWSRVCFQTARKARDPDFRRLVVALSDELERVEVLSPAATRRIYENTIQEELCST